MTPISTEGNGGKGRRRTGILVVVFLVVLMLIIAAWVLLLPDDEPGASPSPGNLHPGDFLHSSWLNEGEVWECIITVEAVNGSGFDCHHLTLFGDMVYRSYNYYASNWTDFLLGQWGHWRPPLTVPKGQETIDTAFGPRLVDLYQIENNEGDASGLMPGTFRFYLGTNNQVAYLAEYDYEDPNTEDYTLHLVESNIAWV